MNEYLKVVVVVWFFYVMQFFIGQRIKNNSIVDIFWGMGFVVATVFAVLENRSYSLMSVVTMVLVSIWGTRLTYHIAKRNIGKPEDFRYVAFRKQWGTKWVRLKAFLHVYMLQFVMLLLISSAAINTILTNRVGVTLLDIIGILIWCVGFYFEAKADFELTAFKNDPQNKGKIMTEGLYKYTRHPNYFGEAVMWWGIYLIGFSSGGWGVVISPLTITMLVRYVSGVPLLEKHYEGNKAFEQYAERTNIFIPWFPKEKVIK